MSHATSNDAAPLSTLRSAHISALVTATLVFPLVLVGAGVTSQEAGMAFPDWPTSNEHLLNPPGWTEHNDQLWEHGHRLIGWVVGMSAIVLAATTFQKPGVIRWLGPLTLLAIVVQGVMGGLRVTEESTRLAMLHGIWGQLCFCLACASALVTSSGWLRGSAIQAAPAAHVLKKGCVIATGAVLVQLTFGAALRHFASNAALVAHLLWVVPVTLLVAWVAMWVVGQHPARDLLGGLGRVLGLLLMTQLLLGGFTLLTTTMGMFQESAIVWIVPSAHVAVGALMLATTLLLTMSVHRRLYTRELDAPTGTEAVLS